MDGCDLSVVIVSWNVRELLPACLNSLARELARSRLASEVIVVDNDSTDGTVELVRQRYPWVHLIALEANRGFAAANNVGIRASRGEAILLLNPDTEVRPGAISWLWSALQAAPHVGLVGARLLNPDGSLQSAGYRFPGYVQNVLDFFPIHPRLIGSRLNGRFGPGDGLSPFAIDHPLGACMLVRRAVIEQVGGLDEGYFYYSEEIDWCRRIRAAGWTILTAPAALVVHHAGGSTRQVSARSFLELHRSRARYFRRWHGPRFVQRLALLASLAAGWSALRAHLTGRPELAERACLLQEAARIYRQASSDDEPA
ncbi:glycosyltransferase family 2 protein [Thermomicrobium sp. 4228-Ro]|uniref:glycosyltransferase family 2 protein n=1 Tax=Thermomicrobium sp. 4228-Ro TaxID=2993937 RepID=UPI002248A9A9|nr:glycosyltransferase family 2 protein [Thermomicrobium sp. 4228-Ro]MCX2727140.1 glycosyltransferase family 2 protein [Thermomicrobium sp. 4228-Ro]